MGVPSPPLGHVVVEDDVGALDVDAAAEQVGWHQDPLLEVLQREGGRDMLVRV